MSQDAERDKYAGVESHPRQRAVLRHGLAFSLTIFAVDVGCTRDVPDATGQDTSPSGANLPDAGSSQGPSSNPEASGKSKDASSPEGSNQDPGGDAGGGKSQVPSNEVGDKESQTPSGQACEDQASRECVQAAPHGWEGPFRVNRSNSLEGIERCKSPAPQVEMLYDDWVADKTNCRGCTPSVLLPPCQPIELVGHKSSVAASQPPHCSPEQQTKSIDMIYDDCESMQSLLVHFPSTTRAYSYNMPKTLHKQASCDTSEPIKILPPIRAKTYWRVCENPKDLPACKAKGMSCLKKRKDTGEQACIYSLLRTECPDQSIYRYKIEAATEFEDARSCSKCSAQLIHGTKSDDFECEVDFKLFQDDLDGCHPDSASSSENTTKLKRACQKHEVIWDRDQYFYIKQHPPKYSGSCKKVGWEPIGSVRASKWATICCTI